MATKAERKAVEIAAHAHKDAGREVARETGEKTGVKQAQGVAASQNPFGTLAKTHASHLDRANTVAMADLAEAAEKTECAPDNVELYILAFKSSLAKIWEVKPAVVNVYASERKRMLTVWNTESEATEGKTFGKFVAEKKLGYNKAKKLAATMTGKQRKSRGKGKGDAEVKAEPKGLPELKADLLAVIGNIAALGFGNDQQFKKQATKFLEFIDTLEAPKVPVTGESEAAEEVEEVQEPERKAA